MRTLVIWALKRDQNLIRILVCSFQGLISTGVQILIIVTIKWHGWRLSLIRTVKQQRKRCGTGHSESRVKVSGRISWPAPHPSRSKAMSYGMWVGRNSTLVHSMILIKNPFLFLKLQQPIFFKVNSKSTIKMKLMLLTLRPRKVPENSANSLPSAP